jgi:Kef-type K+ transport system membrane component KefB
MTAHGVNILPILQGLVLILVGAKVGGLLFDRLKLPSVLGELVIGVILGNLQLVGFDGFSVFRDLPGIDVLAQIGVIFLLFDVGLESDVAKMRAVGLSSFLVATLGVIGPLLLGYLVSRWFFPTHHPLVHWFVGGTLTATSVGITARVLSELGQATSVEGRIILGAAVIDDVLGLLVLAVIAGAIGAADRGGTFGALSLVWILARALLFLTAAIILGQHLSRRTFRIASRFAGQRLLLPLAVIFCFGLAALAGAAGLAPIVGAFAAGLVLDEVHYRELREREADSRDVRELLSPVLTLFVPVFFVLMGMRVDLSVFGRRDILGFAAVLTVVAIVGKQICSIGIVERGTDRIAVGLGMIPRGEVGLIFASVGATLVLAGRRVVDPTVFSAVVVVVSVTTLLTPPLLVWRMRGTDARKQRKARRAAGE